MLGRCVTREESNPESHSDNLVGVRAAHRIISWVPYLGNSGLPHQIDTVIVQSWSNKKLKSTIFHDMPFSDIMESFLSIIPEYIIIRMSKKSDGEHCEFLDKRINIMIPNT